MHADCMNEIAAKVKAVRLQRANELRRLGYPAMADYGHNGEMRGYFKVLEMICSNPDQD